VHLETTLAYCEVLDETGKPVADGDEGRLVVTTIGVDGSPLVRFDTGDLVRRLPPCACGSPRPGIVVLGRAGEGGTPAGRGRPAHLLVAAAGAAADALDSSVFLGVVLPDRFLVRVETDGRGAPPEASAALHAALGDLPAEIETVPRDELLDIELLGRSPHVYKPIVLSDWTRPARHVLTLLQGT